MFDNSTEYSVQCILLSIVANNSWEKDEEMTAAELWQWRDAMKSGRYTQYRGMLRWKTSVGVAHCGLGVLMAEVRPGQTMRYPADEPKLMSRRLESVAAQLNDRNELNQYASVIADIEMAAEDYITE